MNETHIIRKKVEGKVKFNDGQFAEVLIYGIEGIDRTCSYRKFSSIGAIRAMHWRNLSSGSLLACGWTFQQPLKLASNLEEVGRHFDLNVLKHASSRLTKPEISTNYPATQRLAVPVGMTSEV